MQPSMVIFNSTKIPIGRYNNAFGTTPNGMYIYGGKTLIGNQEEFYDGIFYSYLFFSLDLTFFSVEIQDLWFMA